MKIQWFGIWLIALPAFSQTVRLEGRVVSPTRSPIAGARILSAPRQAFSDVQGNFTLEFPAPGAYRVSIEHAGFFPLRDQLIEVDDRSAAIFTLEPKREVTESIEVGAKPLSVDMDTTTPKATLGIQQIFNIPYANTNDFRSALRILPGVIRDQKGGLHMHGGAEEQTLYTLNGFTLNDPLSGRFETRFSVESVQSAELSNGVLPAEFGKGSAGALVIRSDTGADRIRYTATNFFPGFENRKGWTIGDWTPRANLSGPIVRGRAWFSNSIDTQFVKVFVRDLPKGEDRTPSLRLSNLFTTQVNLTPSHILHAGLLWNQWNAPRTGLGVLDPRETTVDRRTRQWFFHAKDQIYLSRGALIEFGYAGNRTFGREIPQGWGTLIYTPEGKRGFHFVDAVRKGARDQLLAHGFLPQFTLAGSHQLKVGIDLNRLNYFQDVSRSAYENYDESGVRLLRTQFMGSGQLERSNYETTAFVQDSWRVRSGLLIETGLRLDWDQILRRWSPAPRFGFAWSPGWSANAKFYGGYARIYDATNLRLFSRPQDQYSLTTYFYPNGAVNRGPSLNLFDIPNPNLDRPRADTVNLGYEHHWEGSVAVRVDLLHRRASRGFTYLNQASEMEPFPLEWLQSINAQTLDSIFALTNQRLDSYRAAAFTVRQNFRRQYEWRVNYTYSRALSNAVADISVDDPIAVFDNSGPMPWDSPHRLLSYAYLPMPRTKWAVAYLLDARSGFPYSVRRETGQFEGAVNTLRYPFFFEMNLHFERRFDFHNHRWAFRFGSNNITDRINPDTVNNIFGSSRFGQFYGGNGRSFNFRIRWLGKAR